MSVGLAVAGGGRAPLRRESGKLVGVGMRVTLKRAPRWYLAGGLCLALAMIGATSSAVESERWKVLVVADRTVDALPADHPGWRQVDESIANQLIAAGFSIYDKTALLLECAAPPCGDRPVAEYVRWARGQRGGIDLMVIYSISAHQQRGPAVTHWRLRVPGRMVDVETSEVVDQWAGGEDEHSDQPGGLSETALRAWLADKLAITGATVGDVLAEKLSAYRREFVYRIDVEGLALGEFDRLESALRSAPAYAPDNLKAPITRNMHREWLHSRASRRYELRTQLGEVALNKYLHDVLADAGVTAVLRYEARELSIIRQGTPYVGRYASGVLLTMVALMALWLARAYRQHEIALARTDSARESLRYLEGLSSRGLPWLPEWRRRAITWREQVERVDSAIAGVRRGIDDGAFDEATTELAQAQALEPRHPELMMLAESLPRQRKAATLIARAQAQQEIDPADAARALTEAIALDPERRAILQPQLDTLQERLRRGAVHQALEQAQAALTQGQVYRALSAVGKGMAAIRGLDGMAQAHENLRCLADQARSSISPLTGPMRGVGLLDRVRVVVDDDVDIGRGSVADVGAVALGYKRASRIGKQTQLRRDRSGLQIMDLGSTNGTELDGRPLPPHSATRLSSMHTLSLGGNRESGATGACRLSVRVIPGAAGSAALACDPAPLRLLDPAQLAAAWPTREQDLLTVWLALSDPVPLMLDEVLLPTCERENAVIALGYDHGYFLVPVDETKPAMVRIDGEPITTRTPISATAQLTINDRPFGLVPW